MYTPEFSFVTFRPENQPLPYISMDDIAFQVISDVPITSVVMTNMSGENIEETENIIISYGDRYFIRPQFTSLPDCFMILLKNNGTVISGFSNVFVRVYEYDYSSRIEYRSREDNFEFTYCPRFFFNAIRLPLYIKDPRFAQNTNVYNRRNGSKKIVSASISREYTLETDYLTEDTHYNLIIALMHDEVYINGQLLTKTGDYAIDWNNYLKDGGIKTAKGTCTVSANSLNRSSNCGNQCGGSEFGFEFDVQPRVLYIKAS